MATNAEVDRLGGTDRPSAPTPARPFCEVVASAGAAAARVAVVGNPNTGKSTLFGALSGLRVRTGNYPGVTVSSRIGRVLLSPGSLPVDLIDLPGTYSLAPRSPDEMVAVDVLTGQVIANRTGRRGPTGPPDAVLVVLNATLLRRNFFLLSQVLQLGLPTVVVLNMIDVAAARGLSIDLEKLSRRLGVPVVAVSASRQTGLDELRAALAATLTADQSTAASPPQRERLELMPADVVAAGQELVESTRWPADRQPPDPFVVQRMLIDRGGQAEQRWAIDGPIDHDVLIQARRRLTEQHGDLIDVECGRRYDWAARTLQGVLATGDSGAAGWTGRLDAVLTHRVGGLLLFVLLMLGILQTIYTVAGIPMDWIDGAFGAIGGAIESLMDPGPLRSLLVDGVVAGVGGVVIFVPQIAMLFAFLAILEDCGYLARAAYLVDRVMRVFGLSGRSFLPLMSSFACAVPGILATRVIENRRDRFATLMIAPLMSCSARLPVYLLLIGAFIPAVKVAGFISLPALVLLAMYSVGAIAAIPMSLILKSTLLRGETAPFVLELPEYKWPSPSVIGSRVWEATSEFIVRAGTLIFMASILIWFTAYWPGDHSRQYALQRQIESGRTSEAIEEELSAESSRLLENSLLGRLGHGIEPVVRPLGWDWKIGVGALASFPAREVIISTLGTIYSLGGDVDEEDAGLIAAISSARWPDGRPVYTIPTALSVMVFFALCAQCVSTLLVIGRETRSWFWPTLSFTSMTAMAYVAAWATYQIGTWWLA